MAALLWMVAAIPPAAAQVAGPAEAPSGLHVVNRAGRVVTLGWTAPTAGDPPTGYQVAGGLHPGEVLGTVGVGPETAVTFQAPPGVFLVRVHAVRPAGLSEASNEITLVVEAPVPPSAPANLLGAASGSTLSLSWTRTFDGGTPERLWLLVSGTLNGALALADTESFTIGNVPDGTYTLQLVAENASGTSPPSNPVTLTFPAACVEAPGAPRDFRAWREGTRLSIAWAPPVSGSPATSYLVTVAGSVALAISTTERVVTAEAPDGNYVVGVSAVNACGTSPVAPAAPLLTTITTAAGLHTIHWPPAGGTGGYRVFWSASRADLEAMGPSLPYWQVAGSPAVAPVGLPDQPVYVRVAALHGPVAGPPGPIALSTTFQGTEYVGWPAIVTPALFDVDGDGCLDMVGARGHCADGFERYSMSSAGLDALSTNFAKNRDSRFADFTGDGIVDIFTNVYTRADDTEVEAVLHVGVGDGTYVVDPGVAAMDIRGYGETVLAADFDNDGDLDVFLPHYTHLDDGGRNHLLINDGAGHFTDVADTAGVGVNQHFPPEGAQALDWDQDGWIDIHVASHLFRNNGDLTFTDIGPDVQSPVLFDEGMRLTDVDLDGDLDLVHNDSSATRLYRNHGGQFDAGTVIDGVPEGPTVGYGLNVCDVNGDGFEDLVVANNDRTAGAGTPHLLVNVAGQFVRSDMPPLEPKWNDLLGCADIDGSGLPDIVGRWADPLPAEPTETPQLDGYRTYRTRGEAPALRLRIVGTTGAKNQQGRPVRIRPRSQPALTMLRAVESGSGYMAQNGYDLLVSTPWPGLYDVDVRVGGGWVHAVAAPGDALTIYEDGRVEPGLH